MEVWTVLATLLSWVFFDSLKWALLWLDNDLAQLQDNVNQVYGLVLASYMINMALQWANIIAPEDSAQYQGSIGFWVAQHMLCLHHRNAGIGIEAFLGKFMPRFE